MKAMEYFNQAVELDKIGEDGSGMLSLRCGSFEFAQLNAAIPASHEYRHLVDDGMRTAEATGRI